MKRLKKILALAMAMAMVLSMAIPSFAASTDDATTKTTATPRLSQESGHEGQLVKDTTLKIGGLDAGDAVTYYKVIGWNNGWVLEDAYKSTAAGDGKLTDADLTTIVGTATTAGAISYDMANKIAGISATGTDGGTVAAGETEWSATVSDPGLYLAVISAAKSGVIYNPVFVAIDYYENDSSVIELVNNGNSYSDNAQAKKKTLTLEKTADSITEANVGEYVNFTITTTIPKYPKNYTGPVFTLNDQLSKGLDLDTTSIKVYTGTGDGKTELVSPAGGKVLYDITPTEGTTTTGDKYEVAFNSENYIQTLTAPQEITITYRAKITGTVEQSVNPEDNTVTLKYSNRPTDTTGSGRLKDVTEHYTFDIDGNLLGNSEYPASEVVKVGVDKDGNEITKTIQLPGTQNPVGALEGAEFTLYKADTSGAKTDTVYTNTYTDASGAAKTFDGKVKSDANGRISIKGLAEGTYYLVETKAPDGYIKATEPVKIVIDATTSEKEVTETIDGIEVKYNVTSLDSYKVYIDDVETASYTITNKAAVADGKTNSQDGVTAQSANEGDTVVGADGLIGANDAGQNAAAGKIQNKQGVELPSTGGIGTTIFYVVGAILVIGAGVVLITKRRMEA